MKSTNLLTSALCGGLVLFAAGEAMAAEAKIPMVTFFRAARGDHITTSDPTWIPLVEPDPRRQLHHLGPFAP